MAYGSQSFLRPEIWNGLNNFEGGNNTFTAVEIEGITINSKGMVHLVGHFGKTVRLGNNRYQTESRETENEKSIPIYDKGTFLAVLNAKGGVIRATKIGSNEINVADIEVDLNGNTLIAGNYRGTDNTPEEGEHLMPIASFGTLKLTDTGRGQGAFVAQFDKNHKPVWAQAFTSYRTMAINSLAVQNSKIIATGSFYKNAQIGSRKLVAPDQHLDAYMVTLANTGEIDGVRHFSGANSEKVSVIKGPNNSALLYGSFKANMAAKGAINTSKGRYENGFLYKMTP